MAKLKKIASKTGKLVKPSTYILQNQIEQLLKQGKRKMCELIRICGCSSSSINNACADMPNVAEDDDGYLLWVER